MIEDLKKLGLNDYQAKAYLALLKYGTQTGGEVAKHSEIPPTRVFDVLKSLVDKGLADMIGEKPMLFKALKPEKGLGGMIERKIEDLKASETDLIKSLKVFQVPISKPRIHEKITTVLGFRKMFSHFVEWAKTAKSEILIYSVGEEIPFSVKTAVRKAVKGGIKIRFIATRHDEENKHILKEFKTFGWKMRHYPSTQEFTFSVIDKKECMINVRNPEEKEERISIFFEIPGLAKSLAEYYEVLWKKSEIIKF